MRHETNCSDAILDSEVGGPGPLPRVSVGGDGQVTTALRSPSKKNPCRVGLVSDQHANLYLSQHDKAKNERKNLEREFRDYLCWLAGWWIRSGGRKF